MKFGHSLLLLLAVPALALELYTVRTVQVGGFDGRRIVAMTTGPGGDAYVVGYTSRDAGFHPSGALRTRETPFSARVRESGEIVYSVEIELSAGGRPSAVAVDPDGGLIAVGSASAISEASGLAAFVSKVAPDGSILYTRTLGGAGGGSEALAVAVDSAGDIYVTGETSSPNFPTTVAAFQSSRPPQGALATDAFVAKLSGASGETVYATYLGGADDRCLGSQFICDSQPSNTDRGTAIAVDTDGHAYVAGATNNRDFPRAGGAIDADGSIFVTKLAADGSAIEYSALFGGAPYFVLPCCGPGPGVMPFSGPFPLAGSPRAMSLEPDGAIVLAGRVRSEHFPATQGAWRTSWGGGHRHDPSDGFVLRLEPGARRIEAATYWGDADNETVTSLQREPSGAVLFAGFRETEERGVQVGFVGRLEADLGAVLSYQEFPEALAGGDTVMAGHGVVAVGTGSRARAVSWLEPRPAVGPAAVSIASAAAGSPLGAVSPGEIVTILGLDLGPDEGVAADLSGGRAPVELAGSSVLVNGVAAPLLYVGRRQINAVVPLAAGDSPRSVFEFRRGGVVSPLLDLARIPASPNCSFSRASTRPCSIRMGR